MQHQQQQQQPQNYQQQLRPQPISVTNDKICPICTEKSDTPHQIHYGGMACFSCKAFFRRAHQRTVNPNFHCKRGNNCVVDLKTRRRCQKCRYDICIANGMKPTAVLTGEAKNHRFRNAIRKKAARREAEPAYPSPEFVHDDDEEEEEEPDNTNNHQEQQREQRDDRLQGPEPREMSDSKARIRNALMMKKMAAAAAMSAAAAASVSGSGYDVASTSSGFSDDSQQSPASSSTSASTPTASATINNYLEADVEMEPKKEKSTRTSSNKTKLVKFTEPSSPSYVFKSKKARLEADDCGDLDSILNYKEELAPPYTFNMKFAGKPGSEFGVKQVEKIFRVYLNLCKKTPIDPEFTERLMAMHLRKGILSRRLFLDHVRTLGEEFKDFAYQHADFLKLTYKDQRRLLARNTPLFIQYRLARYFTAPDGFSQIYWLLGPQMPDTQMDPYRIGLNTFDRKVGLFVPGAAVDKYKSVCKEITKLPPQVKFRCNAVLSHIIIFSCDDAIVERLDDPGLVRALYDNSLAMCPHSAQYVRCAAKPDLPNLLDNLSTLAKFFAQNVNWSSSDDDDDLDEGVVMPFMGGGGRTRKYNLELTPTFTPEENNWIQFQIDSMRSSFNEVSLGEDLVREFAMFSLGVPVSKSFFFDAVAAFSERLFRAMKTFKEFNDLSDVEQTKICQRNFMGGVALKVAYNEAVCETAKDQIRASHATKDNKVWAADFDSFFSTPDAPKLKKMRFEDLNITLNLMTPEQVNEFNRLCASIGSVIKSPEAYHLLILVVMFSGDGTMEDDTVLSAANAMSRLRDRFFTALRRQQHDQVLQIKFNNGNDTTEADDLDEESFAFGRHVYSRLNSCLTDIRKLAILMQNMSPPSTESPMSTSPTSRSRSSSGFSGSGSNSGEASPETLSMSMSE